MARRASARSVRQGCFLPEWRSPFVRVKAKQRQSAAQAAVMQLAKPHWQAKSRAMLPANSRAIRRVLLQANSRVKTADPPSPGLRREGWRPPLLGAQD